MNSRNAILEGAKKATRLHEVLGIKDRIERASGRIDVFDAINTQGAVLLFQPLQGIIGAYVNEGTPGILVTTLRTLPVQRFTAAHELGHFYMGHGPCEDGDEILGGSTTLAAVEAQANAFAAEFLAPKWLLFYHGKRQKWNAESITDPVVVYQLSLRLGISYEATCHSLRSHGIISQPVSQNLLSVPPKKIKRQILPASYEPENWYLDVWLLTECDRGTRIEGHPEDLFVVQLREDSIPGAIWSIEALRAEGFQVVADSVSTSAAGDMREIALGPAPHLSGKIELHHPDFAAGWSINYDVAGKERGLPRALRGQTPGG